MGDIRLRTGMMTPSERVSVLLSSMKDPALLCDADFLAWTEQQAKVLRAAARGRTNPCAGTNQPIADQPLDWEHLAEEIESLGLSERRELHSQVHRIIRHLLRSRVLPRRDCFVPAGQARGSSQ